MTELRTHEWVNIDFDEPFNSFIPPRPTVVLDPNAQSLNKMHLYGFTSDQVVSFLSDPDCANTPVVCIYHLVDESRRRKAAKLARKNQAAKAQQQKQQQQIQLQKQQQQQQQQQESGVQSDSGSASNQGINLVPLDNSNNNNNNNNNNRAMDQQKQPRLSLTPSNNVPPQTAADRRLSTYSISQDIKDVEGSKTPVFLDSPSIVATQLSAGLRVSKTQKGSDVRPTTGDSFNWDIGSVHGSDANASRMSKSFANPSRLFARLRKSMPFLKFRKSMAFVDPKPLQKGIFDRSKNQSTNLNVSDRRHPSVPPPPPPIPLPAKPSHSPPSSTSYSNNPRSNKSLSRAHSTHTSTNNAPSSHRRKTETLQNHTPIQIHPSQTQNQTASSSSYNPTSNGYTTHSTPIPRPHSRLSSNSNLNSPSNISTNLNTIANSYTNSTLNPNHPLPPTPPAAAPISGIFTIKTTVLRPLFEIHQDLDRVLLSHSVAYRKITEFFFFCEDRSDTGNSPNSSPSHRFEIHINNIQGNLFTIKFKRIKGSWWAHKKLAQRLIKDMGN
ncbi:hypothetical protein AX774_g7934 [Zancudomyces culisetae]|uniref:non-specific serine/threonine protein kinase n=1 Tax=Zancudomyces culisetae TaxID=1213189 RepID=A0A1R1PCI3_ZANCU|nr:hypothetical protein AX774_g7934 [Zancudomyces culisetae]|eukprot:OMH78670.1 hypothetical protein AX774_g7934 [Zancudomyces culisetae]